MKIDGIEYETLCLGGEEFNDGSISVSTMHNGKALEGFLESRFFKKNIERILNDFEIDYTEFIPGHIIIRNMNLKLAYILDPKKTGLSKNYLKRIEYLNSEGIEN